MTGSVVERARHAHVPIKCGEERRPLLCDSAAVIHALPPVRSSNQVAADALYPRAMITPQTKSTAVCRLATPVERRPHCSQYGTMQPSFPSCAMDGRSGGHLASLDSRERSRTRTSSSNQSETESDSDGSISLAPTSYRPLRPLLPSILRIRTEDREQSHDGTHVRAKKSSSVEFAIDIEIDNGGINAGTHHNKHARHATRSHVPRRLTSAEKAVLYRLRPDLDLTPMPYFLPQWQEHHRRRQRRLIFLLLGAALLLLTTTVFYYVLDRT